MVKKKSTDKKIIQEAFKLIKKIGWTNFKVQKLYEDCNFKKTKINDLFKKKSHVLHKFSEMIDQEVLSSVQLNELNENDAKDNLFELIMTRFEKLNPYRDTLKIILKDFKTDPESLRSLYKKIFNSLDFYMELSNAKNFYFFDLIKSNIFFLIYSFVFRIWLEDNSKDMNSTMKELDKLLSTAEVYSRKFDSFF